MNDDLIEAITLCKHALRYHTFDEKVWVSDAHAVNLVFGSRLCPGGGVYVDRYILEAMIPGAEELLARAVAHQLTQW